MTTVPLWPSSSLRSWGWHPHPLSTWVNPDLQPRPSGLWGLVLWVSRACAHLGGMCVPQRLEKAPFRHLINTWMNESNDQRNDRRPTPSTCTRRCSVAGKVVGRREEISAFSSYLGAPQADPQRTMLSPRRLPSPRDSHQKSAGVPSL